MFRIPYNDNGNTLANLTSKDDLEAFIGVHLISLVYNNSLKDYPGMHGPQEHYLKEFNKVIGLRFTARHTEFKENTGYYKEPIPTTRKTSYTGRTNKNFDYIETDPYPPTGTPYSFDGGYNGKGGYVFYFNDSLTIEEANAKFVSMDPKQLFSNPFLAITAELMVYNENYQTGVIVILEFLSDNSGTIVPQINTYMFFTSMYNNDYHQNSSVIRIGIFIMNGLYLVLVIYLSYKEIKYFIRTLRSSCSQGVSMFVINDLASLAFLLLNYLSVIFFIITVIFETEIQTSNVNEDKFNHISSSAELLYIHLMLG